MKNTGRGAIGGGGGDASEAYPTRQAGNLPAIPLVYDDTDSVSGGAGEGRRKVRSPVRQAARSGAARPHGPSYPTLWAGAAPTVPPALTVDDSDGDLHDE